MSSSTSFLEEVSGDYTLKTLASNALVTIDTGLSGTTLITGDLSVVGNVAFAGNASLVSNAISSGTSKVQIPVASGNVDVVVNNVGLATFYSEGISVVGNVTGNYILGNGAFLSGLPESYSNANVANYLPLYTGNLVSLQGDVSTTANITGNYILGNGALLTGLPEGYSNANVANFLVSYTGNISAGNVIVVSSVTAATVSASGNVTGAYLIGDGSQISNVTAVDVGVLTSLSVTGNIDAGNLRTAGQVSAAGNVSAAGVVVAGTGGDITGANNISATGNIVGGNLLSSGVISTASTVIGSIVSATANIVGGNIVGGNLFGTDLSLTGNATIDGRITGTQVKIGTDSGLTNQGYGAIALGLNAGYNNQGQYAIAIGVSAGDSGQANNSIVLNASGSPLNGSTANAFFVNPIRNNTSNVGNLVFYNASTKEVTYANTANIAGNISASYFIGNGSQLTGVTATEVGVLTSLSVTGNIQTGNLLSNGVISSVGGISTTGDISTTGNVFVDGNLSVTGNAFLSGNIVGDRIQNGNTIIDIQTAGGNANVSVGGVTDVAVFSPAGLSLPGNVSTGNLLTDNIYYANGQPWDMQQPSGSNTEIQFNNNGNFGASANLTFDSATNIFTTGNISATGTVNATGNVTGGNIITGGSISTTGTLTAGNTTINGDLTVTGNASLSGNILADRIVNGTSEIDIQTAGGNANITIGGISNVAVFSTSGQYVTGLISASGNITSGNFITAGNASVGGILTDNYYYANGVPLDMQQPAGSNTQIQFNDNGNFGASANLAFDSATNLFSVNGTANITGNVAGSNIETTGIISATGNITGGNLSGTNIAGTLITAAQPNITSVGTLSSLNSGTISSSGNITGANINTGGEISATGNIWGGGVRSTASATEPTNPGQGDIWYNTATDVVYRYTYDGTSYYWVDFYGSTLGQNANIVAVKNGTTSVSIPVVNGNIDFAVNGTVQGSFTSSGLAVGNIVNSNAGNAVGNIGSATNYFNTIFSATYTGVHADLAEHYQADQPYTPGTVVVFGGEKEITISHQTHDTRVAGVVSKKPAFIMNNQNPGVLVALTGRVPTYVMGPVSKGDRLVNIAGGVAGRINPALAQLGCIIGKALEDHPAEGQVKLIEIAIGKT